MIRNILIALLYSNSTPFSNHQLYLENWDPNYSNDDFHWIPNGMYYDMVDTQNELYPVSAAISGYSNQKFFNALLSDVKSMSDFKIKPLLQNNNNQSTQINTLFHDYGY